MESATGVTAVRVTKGKIAGLGAILATSSLALTPALSAAVGAISQQNQGLPVSLRMLGAIGSFTPVTNDDKLAKAYAKAARESQSRGFRFTPSSGSMTGRSLTILVRAPGANALGSGGTGERVLPNLGVAPVAYRLGTAKGLERFSVGTRLDPAIPDPMIESKIAEPLPSYTLRPKKDRFSTNIQVQDREANAASPAEDTPQTLGTEKSYAVDLSSSYSLTRNLNVQAGVRYKGPSNRLAPTLTDQTQDSKAVYVGTTFKF
jgi:hypothetical protein